MLLKISFLVSGLISVLMIGVFFAADPALAQEPTGRANISVDQSIERTIAEELTQKVVDSWPWYLTRASGLVAMVALILLTLSGIGFLTGQTYTFLEPLIAWATHRALGIILVCALAIHLGALYFDTFVPFSVPEILIPFLSNYKPIELFGISVGSLYVALGVLSFYSIVLVTFVSLLWVERKTYVWKLIHLMSYIAMAFAFIHALFLGTDLSNGALRTVFLIVGIIILFATLLRLWRAFTT